MFLSVLNLILIKNMMFKIKNEFVICSLLIILSR